MATHIKNWRFCAIKEKIVFFLFFMLSSCNVSSWRLCKVETNCVEYNSAELLLKASNEFSGVALHFLRGGFGILGYAEVRSREILPFEKSPEHSLVLITIENKKCLFQAKRLKGNQKVLLPDEITEKLLTALSENLKVTITLEGFFSEVVTDGFSKRYKKFLALATEAPPT